MLRFFNHSFPVLALILGISWLVGCGAPPAENSAPESTISPQDPAIDSNLPKPEQGELESSNSSTANESTSANEAVEIKSTPVEGTLGEAEVNQEVATSTEVEEKSVKGEEDEEEFFDPSEQEFVEPPPLPAPPGATAMPAPNRVWIDAEKKSVIVDGYVSLREGMLEMFACPVGTKEHESIVAVYSSAQVVHAALLAIGAKTGTPVQFDPDFKPPTGTEIEIEVRWQDKQGQWQSIQAQQLITDIKTEKPMAHPWVFAGSGFYKDTTSGEEYYLAESGDFICVSNFTSATLDIPAESSQVNDGLLFEANPEKVPPLWTAVRLILTPKLDKESE